MLKADKFVKYLEVEWEDLPRRHGVQGENCCRFICRKLIF